MGNAAGWRATQHTMTCMACLTASMRPAQHSAGRVTGVADKAESINRCFHDRWIDSTRSVTLIIRP